MADVKVTGLSAVTPPIDKASLVLSSVYDGVSAYVSEKVTVSELADAVFLMDAEQKITFDSSGINILAVTDVTNGGSLSLFSNANGTGVYLTTDGDGFGTNYIGVWDNGTTKAGYEIGGGGTYYQYADKGGSDEYYLSGHTTGRLIYSKPKASAPFTTAAGLAESSVFCGESVTVNAVDNSIGLGGSGYTIDKSDYAFAQNLEVQGGVFSHTGTNVGFFNTTPVAKPTSVAVSAAGIHAALTSLGLIS